MLSELRASGQGQLQCTERGKVSTGGARHVDRVGMTLQALEGLESHCEDFDCTERETGVAKLATPGPELAKQP